MANDTERQALVSFLQELVKGSGEKKPANKAFSNIEAAVEYSGTKIILPGDPRQMKLGEAREWLTRLEAAEEQAVSIHEVIDAHPWDGCVAFMQAMKETYGWAQPVPTPTFFGPRPPQMLTIETGVGETTQIFWGSFRLPGIEAQLATATEEKRGQMRFVIEGSTKRKHLEMIRALADLTRRIVQERSIYRGHAIKLALDGSEINLMEPPTFMNLKRVREDELVFSEDLMDQVITNLWTPIEQTGYCRTHDVPLKRGVLLEGPYGTGKTLAATVTAKKCEANGWTFITVGRVSALESALQFATNYQPCVVFVEDIDREMAGERTVEMDDILNKIDGIISKGAEIMVVLTSNAASQINRAMLRPGRLDAVLHIGPPDADAVQKLLRVYGRRLIRADADLSEAGLALAGRIPAVIREVVERSKLYAIARAPGKEFTLTDSDIVRSARGMAHHLALLDGKQEPEKSPAQKLGDAFGEMIKHHLGNGSEEGLLSKIDHIQTMVNMIDNTVDQIRENQ